jgi:CPA1 family monovalent cation:H+ antiporter
MGQAELLIAGLLVAVAGLSAIARMLSVPYPIVLVVGGAVLGFVPGLPEVRPRRKTGTETRPHCSSSPCQA